MTLLDILALYLAFRAKQLICDFFLQTSWMANVKGSPFNMGGAKALGLHAGIHAAFTFVLMIAFAPAYWWLGFVDLFIHGLIDRVKAEITNRKGWTYKDNVYWWAFGLDQEAHNLTHLCYIIAIVYGVGFVSG
jgi:Protein of unknown function (DUF3307)